MIFNSANKDGLTVRTQLTDGLITGKFVWIIWEEDLLNQ